MFIEMTNKKSGEALVSFVGMVGVWFATEVV